MEHVFQVMKLKFGFVKVRYRGLKKNAHQLFVICGLVIFFSAERSCCWRPAHNWKMPLRAAVNEGEDKKPEVER